MKKNRILVVTIFSTTFIVILCIYFSTLASDNTVRLKAQNSIKIGYQAYKAQNYSKAIEHLNESYQLMPQSKVAYYLSRCYFELNNSRLAHVYAQHALSDMPQLNDAYRKNAKTIISWAEKARYKSRYIAIDGKAYHLKTKSAPRPKLDADPIETEI